MNSSVIGQEAGLINLEVFNIYMYILSKETTKHLMENKIKKNWLNYLHFYFLIFKM